MKVTSTKSVNTEHGNKGRRALRSPIAKKLAELKVGQSLVIPKNEYTLKSSPYTAAKMMTRLRGIKLSTRVKADTITFSRI
jgi:hypothetical protein